MYSPEGPTAGLGRRHLMLGTHRPIGRRRRQRGRPLAVGSMVVALSVVGVLLKASSAMQGLSIRERVRGPRRPHGARPDRRRTGVVTAPGGHGTGAEDRRSAERVLWQVALAT